jgi:tetratricopeptide (TPR) repeat protein
LRGVARNIREYQGIAGPDPPDNSGQEGSRNKFFYMGLKRFFIIYFIIVFLTPCRPTAIDSGKIPPRPWRERYIYDYAEIIKENRGNLVKYLKHYHKENGIEFIIVTVDSIGSENLGAYVSNLFNSWKIGYKDSGRGILLFISKREELAKMEVSYSLEHAFTDAFCDYVQGQQLKPYFEFGDTSMGILDIIHMVSLKTMEEIEEGNLSVERAEIAPGGHLSGGAGDKEEIKIGIDMEEKKKLPEFEKSFFKAQSDPLSTFELYIITLRNDIVDPNLEVYTEGSQFKLDYWPVALYQQHEVFLAAIERGRPFNVVINGDYAVIKMKEGTKRACPYFLRKEGNYWKMDLVSLFRDMRFDRNNEWILANRRSPYVFAFRRDYDPTKIMWPRTNLREKISRLKQKIDNDPNDHKSYIELADIYMNDCWMVFKALRLYEKAAEIRKTDAELYRMLADKYLEHSYFVTASEHYEKYVDLVPDSLYGHWRLYWSYKYMRDYPKAILHYLKYQLIRFRN